MALNDNVSSSAVETISTKFSISHRFRIVKGGHMFGGLHNLSSLSGLKVVSYIFLWILEELLLLAFTNMDYTEEIKKLNIDIVKSKALFDRLIEKAVKDNNKEKQIDLMETKIKKIIRYNDIIISLQSRNIPPVQSVVRPIRIETIHQYPDTHSKNYGPKKVRVEEINDIKDVIYILSINWLFIQVL